jgi:hypothetical protein
LRKLNNFRNCNSLVRTWFIIREVRVSTIHFHTELIIHIKTTTLLDSCLFPLLYIPCIHKNQGNNFYVLCYMWWTIIFVKLHSHLQIISIKKQKIILCMHTHIHTHTQTYKHTLHTCMNVLSFITPKWL